MTVADDLPAELAEARAAIDAVRDDKPFVPDPPGALDAFIAEHGLENPRDRYRDGGQRP